MWNLKGKLLLVLFLPPLLASAQFIKGRVLDANNHQPIPYATLTLEGSRIGTVCNELGEYEFSIPSHIPSTRKLQFSSLAYQSRLISLSQLAGIETEVLLAAKPLSLNEVHILAIKISPKELMRKVLDRIPQNFSSKPYYLKSFYRHYCKENEVYGRLIEAAVDIYHTKGHRRRYASIPPKTELAVRQLRRSLDFTAYSFYNHVPIALGTTLRQDYASYDIPYLRGTLFDKASFTFSDTLSGPILVVQVQTQWSARNYLTDFYINLDKMALVKIEEHWSLSFTRKGYRYLRSQYNEVNYRLWGEKYFLSHIINEGRIKSWKKNNRGTFGIVQDHKHKISWMVNEVLEEGFVPFEGKVPGEEELKQVPYDKNFWDNYNVLAATPLENQIRQDLSQRVKLERQFSSREFLLNDDEVQEKIAQAHYQRFLDENKDKLKLIIFWESENRPKLKDLLTLRKLNKSFSRMPFGLFWVNVGGDKDEMVATIRKYSLYLGNHVFSPKKLDGSLAQSFQLSQTPTIVLLDGNNKLIQKSNKLPSYKAIMKLAKEWGIVGDKNDK